ncbi:tetratricopeptide repeat protein [Bacillus arachidis]|uniref:Tetratricopeptide repeat protein n=1 Tax=Bacillus arachidis TaxID=2819290 RepID=A0ABS3NU48_9BACI|nr:tetratricopeptide repeat protein [Bacillus arachidis]MBO1624457.1 tetratricopeptide repeat protein [Bacillus arachidis]WIY62672.1 tetratricopeptide repeat protein [Bacillus arachidis]
MQKFEQAVSYIENGEAEKGLELLKELVKQGTDEEKYDIARYYHTLGFIDEALAITEDLRLLYPEESEFTIFLAELYIDLDKEDEAIEVLHDIPEDDELYVQSLLLVADLFQMQGFDDVAEQKLLKAKEMMPEEPVITFGLAELYSSKGEEQKAIAYYESLLAEHKVMGGVVIALRLAETLSAIGNWEEAITYYEEGLEEQKDIHSLFGYAFTLYQGEEYQRAIGAWKELKELDPEYASLYMYLAKCYEKEGMLQESYETLHEGIKIDELSVPLYVELANIAAKIGKLAEAEELLQKALQLDPGHLGAILKYAYILKEQEKYEELIAAVENAMDSGEQDTQLLWDLAFAKKQLEMYSDALKHYESAYTSFKNHPDFLEEYGYFLLEEGLRKEAKEVFTRLLQLDPTQIHIEELLYNLEDFS